jgi:hypothetical protein
MQYLFKKNRSKVIFWAEGYVQCFAEVGLICISCLFDVDVVGFGQWTLKVRQNV